MSATPEQIAAAWAAWKVRHKGAIGPGPGFVEAINAALAHGKSATDPAPAVNALAPVTAGQGVKEALQTAIWRLCCIEDSPNLNAREKSLLREWIVELRASAGLALPVIPLEWAEQEQSQQAGEHYAKTPLGDYEIGLPHLYWIVTTPDGRTSDGFDIIAEAKAWAQADYERCATMRASIPIANGAPTEALKPFARAADEIEAKYGSELPDHQIQFAELTMGDLRRARSALAASEGSTDA